MPYLPIDPNEKTTAIPGGTTSQPVPQTGVASGTVGGGGGGGGSGPQGGGAKANNSYTNLTNYLQANAGNTANADAAQSAVFDPLAQNLKDTTEYTPEAVQQRSNLDTAVDRVKTSGGVQGTLEKAYGNTYANQGNKAFDSAVSGRGVLGAAQGVSAGAKATAAKPAEQLSTASQPSGFAVSTPNPVTGGTGIFDPAASMSGDIGSSPVTADQVSAWQSSTPKTPQQMAAADSQFRAGSTPISGGAGHSMMARGGLVPEGGHYENLMNKIKGKC